MYSYSFDGTHCMSCGCIAFRKICSMCSAAANRATAHLSDEEVGELLNRSRCSGHPVTGEEREGARNTEFVTYLPPDAFDRFVAWLEEDDDPVESAVTQKEET